MIKKFYLTKAGLEKVKKEYKKLEALKELRVKNDAPSFLHSDDPDPEYLDFEGDNAALETKIADLHAVLEHAEIIKKPGKTDEIQVGAKVSLDIDGQLDEFTILGSLEANPALGIISDESPVGRALLGRKKGEEVIISSPIKTHYRIKKIRYS